MHGDWLDFLAAQRRNREPLLIRHENRTDKVQTKNLMDEAERERERRTAFAKAVVRKRLTWPSFGAPVSAGQRKRERVLVTERPGVA